MREIGVDDLEDLALGASILGAGGGGDPWIGRHLAAKVLAERGPVRLMAPYELPDESLVIPTAMMGAPTVMLEKVPNGNEPYLALCALQHHLGRKASATMPIECGGLNLLLPLIAAGLAGIPLVDADGMGRAFPELQMETFHIYGVSGTPAVLVDERGHTCLIKTRDNFALERIAREVTVRMGGAAYIAEFPMSGRQVKETAIPGTVYLALRLGQVLRHCRTAAEAVEAVAEVTSNSQYGRAVLLFEGKLSALERQNEGPFARGAVSVEGGHSCSGRSLRVEFQNEYLVATMNGVLVATVPDLIVILDASTARPIPTDALKVGTQVVVMGIPTPALMRLDLALQVWGPRSFGYDFDYVPIELLNRGTPSGRF